MAGETEFTANLLDERPHVFKMAKTSPVALGHSFVFDNIFVVKETLSLMLFKKKKRKNNHGQKEENIFFQTTAARGVGSPRGGDHGGGTERMQTYPALICKHMEEEVEEVKYYFICVKVHTAGFVPQRSRFANAANPTITHLAS